MMMTQLSRRVQHMLCWHQASPHTSMVYRGEGLQNAMHPCRCSPRRTGKAECICNVQMGEYCTYFDFADNKAKFWARNLGKLHRDSYIWEFLRIGIFRDKEQD